MRLHYAGLLCLLFSLSLSSQNAGVPASTRDLQAVQVLQSAIAAAGGVSALVRISDLTETGDVHYGESVAGTATVRLIGTTDIRFDTTAAEGPRSWFVSDGQGKVDRNGEPKHVIPYQCGANLGALTVPVLKLLKIAQDPSFRITYIELQDADSNPVHHIHVEAPSGPSIRERVDAQLLRADYFIDAKTFLITRMEDTSRSIDNLDSSLPHKIEFSDYRTVQGIQLPFHIADSVNRAPTWSLQVSEVKLNTGLSREGLGF